MIGKVRNGLGGKTPWHRGITAYAHKRDWGLLIRKFCQQQADDAFQVLVETWIPLSVAGSQSIQKLAGAAQTNLTFSNDNGTFAMVVAGSLS